MHWPLHGALLLFKEDRVSLKPSVPPPLRGKIADRPASSGLFRAVWRWHFFASFVVLPILLMLATTGLIYLFRFQVEPLLHPDLMKVEAPAAATGPATQGFALQLDAVQDRYPDATPISMTEPLAADEPTRFSVELADGGVRDVFVNPWTTEVLGDLNPDRTLSGMAVLLHGELMAGRVGDAVIELAACWSVVMALTGYFLFFRGRRAARRAQRAGRSAGAPESQLRSRHGLVGAVVGIGLLGLLITGLPWTGVWGTQVQKLATANGSSLWSTDPGALSEPTSTLDESLPHSHSHEIPWGLGKSEVPPGGDDQESSTAGAGEVSVANVDTALAVADREGLRHPMTVALPADDAGVFSVIGYAFDAPSDEETVHVDRFDAEVVATYGFDDYPVLAKVVSQGIGAHEGRSFGLVSFWGSALMCLSIIFLCVSGPLMWWRRRPRGGGLSAPRGRMPLRTSPWLLIGLVLLGVLLPVFGLSLLLVLALDQLVLRRVPRLAGWFSTS